MTDSFRENPQELLQHMIHSQHRSDLLVRILRILTLLLVLAILISSTIICVKKQDSKVKLERAAFVFTASKTVSWFFLACALGILASILYLYYSIRKRVAKGISFPQSFRKEMKNLWRILIVFFFTYFLRFVSDYFILPTLKMSDTEFYECIYYSDHKVCASDTLIIYFTLTNLLWDYLPLTLIFWFHYKSFKLAEKE